MSLPRPRLVDMKHALAPLVSCSACELICIDPQRTVCKHTYCRACLPEQCTVCDTELTNTATYAPKGYSYYLPTVMVICSACSSSDPMMYHEFDEHATECFSLFTVCDHCEIYLRKADLNDHYGKCQATHTQCEDCGEFYATNTEAEHDSTCSNSLALERATKERRVHTTRVTKRPRTSSLLTRFRKRAK